MFEKNAISFRNWLCLLLKGEGTFANMEEVRTPWRKIIRFCLLLFYLVLLIYLAINSTALLNFSSKLLETVSAQKRTAASSSLDADSPSWLSLAVHPSLDRLARFRDDEQEMAQKHEYPKDFSQPIHFRLLPWAVNCSSGSMESWNSAPSLVVILKSRPDEYFQRMAVRQTWGASYRGRMAFLIGQPQSDDTLLPALRLEWSVHGDIILADFVDSYHNLSLKSLASLQWINEHCQGPKFYLQGDSDVLVYPENVKEFLRKRADQDKTIFGLCWLDARVQRNGKWTVPKSDYLPLYYPIYCAGGAFFMSGDVPQRLLTVLDRKRLYFPIDDVFFTGILAEKALVRRVRTPGIYLLSQVEQMKQCDCLRLLATFEYKTSTVLTEAWKQYLAASKECPS